MPERQSNSIHISVHPEMVDFGSDQGRSVFATAGVVLLRRKSVNGYAIIAKKRERRSGPKDAIYGSTLPTEEAPMTRQIAYADTQEFLEYHGNTAIERIIRQDNVTVTHDWLMFNSVEEASDYFNDNC
jgi:hypothetical protein